MSRCFLSEQMIGSEALMVYSGAYHSSVQNTNNFTVGSSQSQGFTWNQDLFASQYQQMCKVVYDGHEDSIGGLVESIKEKYKMLELSRQRSSFSKTSGEEVDCDEEMEDDDEALVDCDGYYISHRRARGVRFFNRSDSGSSTHPHFAEEFNRPRRISERSISFVSDSKNGNYNRSDIAVIEVESDTPENNHLRWLISSS
ncbi:hypothetical protein HG536_0B05300 [Torulaspora globosa]|uniref:Uncharacterized protein n=1 Tax=Torulaspora globosa TaxID=48254 RepID=A0A7G3ZDS9_9SACH|nr:uncharacterized protein HG536_0B05300 [Torulaspora globosa]QLL31665.1 hypothetical protein HG536_0B05300 [Torulaspora globosa]